MLEMIISLLLARYAPEDGVEPMPTGRKVGPWVELVDVSGEGAEGYWARLDDEADEGVVQVGFGLVKLPTVAELEAELDD
jgi:hypothetical protein